MHIPPLTSDEADRGVSNVVGVVLLVAIAVGSMSIIAAMVFGSTPATGQEEPSTSFYITTDGSAVVVHHGGGDTIDGEELYVLSASGKTLGNYAGTDGQACNRKISTVDTQTTCRVSGLSNSQISVVWRTGGTSEVIYENVAENVIRTGTGSTTTTTTSTTTTTASTTTTTTTSTTTTTASTTTTTTASTTTTTTASTTTTTTATPTTTTATPTTTTTPSDNPPTASLDSVRDESCEYYDTNSGQCKNNGNAGPTENVEYGVDWSASDDNGLNSVTVDLLDSSGTVVDSVTQSASGTSASGTVTLQTFGGYGDSYTVRVTASDTATQTGDASLTDQADGTDP